MPGRTNEQPIATQLNITDFLNYMRPTSGANLAAGAADGSVQLSTLLDFIASNMATIALPVEAFTPELTASGLTVTYSLQHGRYIRVGNLIWVSARIDWTAASGGTGSLRASLPAPAGVNEFAEILAFSGYGLTYPGTATYFAARVRAGEAAVDFTGSGPGVASATSATAAGISPSGRISYSGLYLAG